MAKRPLYSWLASLWLLSMILIPILLWTVGDHILPLAVSVSVLLQAIAVLAILHHGWGGRQTAGLACLIASLSWLLEWIGSNTGLPFGAYQYTERLVPQLLHVPLLIPLAWLMMLPVAWAVGKRITRHTDGWPFMIVSACAFTAWDLFLDPQMVAWNFWRWDEPKMLLVGAYFGIPWINFLGWILGAGGFTLLAARLFPLADLPTRPLFTIYVLTWLLETSGQLFFWGLPGPALVGFVGMGCFVYLAWGDM